MVSRDDDAQADTVTPAALAATAASTGDSHADTLAAGAGGPAAPAVADGARYQLGAAIGAGGMGEVVSASDRRIGRDVAVKRTKGVPGPELAARFLREAQIQGRLDHPAIVPVYDLGVDEHGRPYFVMKRLAGTALADVLAGGPPDARARRRLLAAFVDVCLAVEFAHTRGVIHRDLKPANIMLGDFGEVYVLDWGVARVLRDGPERAGDDIVSLDGRGTHAGAVLGTPGYMAPEQARGDAVTPASDLYALGATLFEILTGAAFARGVLDTSGLDPVPSHRGADVPPELDAICARALAPAPADRFASARALADAVQGYLDGDRDLERRRARAQDHLAAATAALARPDDPAARAAAMRGAGHALALDPDSDAAAALVSRLMLEPPARPPPEVAAELHAADVQAARRSARRALWSFAALCAMLPLALWHGTRRPLALAVFLVIVALNAAHAAAIATGRVDVTPARMLRAFVANVVLVGMLSYAFGPFLIVPTVAAAVVVSFAGLPMAPRPAVLGGIAALAVVLPWLAEASGLLSTTTAISDGALVVHARSFAMAGGTMTAILVGHAVVLMLTNAYAAQGPAIEGRVARDRLAIQAWQLRQMVAAPPPAAADRDTNDP
ncbi:MAG: serine/threonine protein kinase [Myxococcales bacterium]|nr:serine/threonine protein kinase [Myxococcales bacterium]